MPPTKSMRLSVRTSAMPRTGASRFSWRIATSSERTGSSAAKRARLRLQPVPLPAEEHPEPPRGIGARLAGRRHRELLSHLCEELLLRQPPEVLHDAVVVQDAQLVVGEEHGEEVVVGLVAVVRGVGGLALEADPRRRGRAVVPVGDVERGHPAERRPNGLRLLGRDDPHGVGDAVGRHEVVDRLVPCGCRPRSRRCRDASGR